MVGLADMHTRDATTVTAAHLTAPLATITATISSLTASVGCRPVCGLAIQSWDSLLPGGWLVSGLVIVFSARVSATVPVGCR